MKIHYFANEHFVGIERPDVRQIGILSFATIVNNAYASKELSESAFEKYVRTYFNQFMGKRTNKIKIHFFLDFQRFLFFNFRCT